MTETLPRSRLTDVLRRNSMKALKKHAADLATASSSLPAEATQTRFLRNHFLINPKSLHLLCNEQTLERYNVFAVFKPPFCPMRRADAHENYHKVSVESFVNAALKSQAVLPVLTRRLSPSDVRVRVLNDVDVFASGPVLVSVADTYPHATSLKGFTFEYDVVVAGHILQTTKGGGQGPQLVAPEKLFPDCTDEQAVDCACTFEVLQHCYYSVHPVSLLHFRITSPPSPVAPNIDGYVRDALETCVIGDPVAMGDFVSAAVKQYRPRDSGAPSSSSKGKDEEKGEWKAGGMSAAVNEEPTDPFMSSHVNSMRGDCDFPRVFMHLREVSFNLDLRDMNGDVIGERKVDFHCRKCFDSVLHKHRTYSFRAGKIGLLDGSWTPASEFV